MDVEDTIVEGDIHVVHQRVTVQFPQLKKDTFKKKKKLTLETIHSLRHSVILLDVMISAA